MGFRCGAHLISSWKRCTSRISFSPDRLRTYTSTTFRHDGRHFRIAIIGSGPAGFYTAYRIMNKIEGSVIDMYERLPIPYGLMRFGVAPDHPEVKVPIPVSVVYLKKLIQLQNCEEKFAEIANSPRFNFIGNVSIGEQHGAMPLGSLSPHYDAILFAYGATQDRKLGLPGEDTLKGVYSARAFVGWYNGLPEYTDLAPDLAQGDEAVIIGQGNVALDVARILLQDPHKLRSTDITEHALDALYKSQVKKVRVVGRRGALQAAFTIKELRELMNLPAVSFEGVPSSFIPEDTSKLPRPSRRIMEILRKASISPMDSTPKLWSLDFCLSPQQFNSSAINRQRLGGMTFERTSLSPNYFDINAMAVGTGEVVEMSSSLAFRSIGYKSEPLPGFLDLDIPFNVKLGVIPNDQLGRVVKDPKSEQTRHNSTHFPGLYCAGWVKRGPTGVIASTMQDAFSTADTLAQDWYSRKPFLNDGNSTGLGWSGVESEAEARGCRRVSWQNWQKIDAAERVRGQRRGKPREKFTRIADMLRVVD